MKVTHAFVLPVLGLLATGCTLREGSVSYYDEHPRHFYEERPVVVAQPPGPVIVPNTPPPVVLAPPSAPITVIREAPPPVYAERIPPRPRGDVAWVPGYWARDRERWVWVQGRWDRPPRRGAVWVEPRWEHRGDEFRFSMGFWR